MDRKALQTLLVDFKPLSGSRIGEQMAGEWEKSAGADGQAILKAYRGKK